MFVLCSKKKESEEKKEEERLSYLFEKEDMFRKDVLNWKEGKETQLSSFFKEVKKIEIELKKKERELICILYFFKTVDWIALCSI